MTRHEAESFAHLESFRHIVDQGDGRYAVAMTWLAWVSAALHVEPRLCTTPTQVVSLDSGNAQMIAQFGLSRHSIRRRVADEGRARLARDKARSAERAKRDPTILVPGIAANNTVTAA